jgi:hypothetical protein
MRILNCLDCGKDISNRHYLASLCYKCSYDRQLKRSRGIKVNNIKEEVKQIRLQNKIRELNDKLNSITI